MIIKKGTNLIVKDRRKGTFKGIAKEDFDTEKDEFYPVITKQCVYGMANDWEAGEEIPCRKGISKILIDEENTKE